MTNNSLIEKATKMVMDYNEAENICESVVCISSRVLDWYNNTDITDPQQLAAMALTGFYRPVPWMDVVYTTAFFFPEEDEYQYYVRQFNLDTKDNVSVEDLCWDY